MIKAIWECSKCGATKETKYHNEDFEDLEYLDEFVKYSKHNCLKCGTQCSMTISEIQK